MRPLAQSPAKAGSDTDASTERAAGGNVHPPIASVSLAGDISMEGKYCIVTGSNCGIGLQVARGLMRRGAHVIMACRNMTACQQAASVLRGEGLSGSCACRVVDLENPSSIRAFVTQQAEELAINTNSVGNNDNGSGGGGGAAGLRGGQQPQQGRRYVDVLVNNAGVMGVPPAPDGSDRHLTTNHLGPYLLTRLLLPHMTHGSRIINVASRAHYTGSLSLVPDPNGRAETIRNDTHHWFWQYCRSKLCNVLFTAELQRRYGYGSPFALTVDKSSSVSGVSVGSSRTLEGIVGGIGAHAVSPGLVDTGIARYLLPGQLQWLLAPLRPFFRTPEQGAEVVLYAASSSELQGRNTLFLHDCREKQPSAAARDPRLAADLWRVSAALLRMPEEGGEPDKGSR
ncbi:hypothetical protein VaNZ11_016340 [Volvox africanus]|uniref:Uncharacterized protein n=1 Tax=Volvox africanus TaxID=51714 RepID=A0ABQ5SMK3_9CHLO|nr:hypothetical protein VaNZ11_016340 [Volvox africanus]